MLQLTLTCVCNALPFFFKHKGVEKSLLRTWAWGGGDGGWSDRLSQGKDQTGFFLYPHRRRGVWLLCGRGAPSPSSRRRARPTVSRFAGERPANFSRDPPAGPGRGGGPSWARPRPAGGCGSRSGPGRCLGPLGLGGRGQSRAVGTRAERAGDCGLGSTPAGERGGSPVGDTGLAWGAAEATEAAPGGGSGEQGLAGVSAGRDTAIRHDQRDPGG